MRAGQHRIETDVGKSRKLPVLIEIAADHEVSIRNLRRKLG